jgi:hypothetical protein
MNTRFVIKQDNPRIRLVADSCVSAIMARLEHGVDSVVEIKDPTRTLEQNALMWELLGQLSKQLPWPVDGKMQLLTPDEWKDILTAGLKKSRVAQGTDGGFVMLGSRTSKMSKKEMSELVEMIYAFGAEHGVEFGQ